MAQDCTPHFPTQSSQENRGGSVCRLQNAKQKETMDGDRRFRAILNRKSTGYCVSVRTERWIQKQCHVDLEGIINSTEHGYKTIFHT